MINDIPTVANSWCFTCQYISSRSFTIPISMSIPTKAFILGNRHIFPRMGMWCMRNILRSIAITFLNEKIPHFVGKEMTEKFERVTSEPAVVVGPGVL